MAQTEFRPDVIPPTEVFELEDIRARRRRSSMLNPLVPNPGKLLFFILAVPACSMTILILINYVQFKFPDSCTSPYCATISKQISNQLNESIDPCDNFYDFVCSLFEQNNRIPIDKSSISQYEKVQQKVVLQLRQILDSKTKPSDTKDEKLLKMIYNVCMDTDKMNKNGFKSLHKLSPEFESWPISNHGSANEALSDYDWKTQLIRYRKMSGLHQWIVQFNIIADFENSSKKILEISEPSTLLHDPVLEYSFNDRLTSAYYFFMTRVAKLMITSQFFNNEYIEIHLEEMKMAAIYEIIDFETNLAKIIVSETSSDNDIVYNMQTIGEIDNKKYKMFEPKGFKNFVNELLFTNDDQYDDVELFKELHFNENEPINNKYPMFLEKLDKLLNVTPKRVIKNYLTWQFLFSNSLYLTESIRNVYAEFEYNAYGITKRKPRWEECVHFLEVHLPYAVSATYLQTYFKADITPEIEKMTENIKKEVSSTFQHLNWMDKSTKLVALSKLQNMKLQLSYSIGTMNISANELYFMYCEAFTDTNFFESVLAMKTAFTNFQLKHFRHTNTAIDWATFPSITSAEAYYDYRTNTLNIPASILQEPIYDKEYPAVINYAGIGVIIAHEIFHGFDRIGLQYDEDGNTDNKWTPESTRLFEIKSDEFVNQYNRYKEPITSLFTDGNNTLNENLVDNSAILHAYRAFLHMNSHKKRIKGLTYNGRQLFWIFAGKQFCAAKTPLNLAQLMETGSHAPPRFRLIGPLQNSEDFAHDFKCKEGSYMNPKKKIRVYE